MADCDLRSKLRAFVYDIIGCCQAVHKEKGPELTEYIYQECLEIALRDAKIPFLREYYFHPEFRGHILQSSLRVDFFVKQKVFLECKAIDELSKYERLQLTNYMRNAGIRIFIILHPSGTNVKNSIWIQIQTKSGISNFCIQKYKNVFQGFLWFFVSALAQKIHIR